MYKLQQMLLTCLENRKNRYYFEIHFIKYNRHFDSSSIIISINSSQYCSVCMRSTYNTLLDILGRKDVEEQAVLFADGLTMTSLRLYARSRDVYCPTLPVPRVWWLWALE